jgi:hypothetical protein
MNPVIKKAIQGFPNYLVGDDGLVYGPAGQPLKGRSNGRGYLKVALYNGSRDSRKDFLVHHLVAEAFIGARNSREVNHLSGDKSDNRPKNLEYTDRQGNNEHAYRTGLTPGPPVLPPRKRISPKAIGAGGSKLGGTMKVQCGSLKWKGEAKSVKKAIIAALSKHLPSEPSELLGVYDGNIWHYINFKAALKIAGYKVIEERNGFRIG